MSILRTVFSVLPEGSQAKLRIMRDMLIDVSSPLKLMFIKFWSSNGFLASLYYVFISKDFYREHRAVLKGRLAYFISLKTTEKTSALLRRNTHRLEKGLIMRPRRPVFAEDYILETVRCFFQKSQGDLLCDDELKWAGEVLTEYFSVVKDTPIISRARLEFLQSNFVNSGRNSIPYQYCSLPKLAVSFDQLNLLFRRRRSVRWYQQREVPIDLINKAVNSATLAPSACNRQPYEFYVAHKEQAVQIAMMAGGTVGYSDNISCIIIVVGDLGAYPYERDRHLIYIDGALVSMQLMLAFETLGLSTCAINWSDVEAREQQIAQALYLQPHQRPVMLMAVGYADPEGEIPFSQKKTADLLVRQVSKLF